MDAERITLEYATVRAAGIQLPGRWWLLGVTIVNAAVIWLPFADGISPAGAAQGLFSGEDLPIAALGAGFALAPFLTYMVARLCLGSSLWPIERWVGYTAAALGVATASYLDGGTIIEFIHGTYGDDLWASVGAIVFSTALLVFGSLLAIWYRSARYRDVGVSAMLMVAYIVNACWPFVLAWNYGVNWGAMVCAAVCGWFLVTLAILFVRALAIGRREFAGPA